MKKIVYRSVITLISIVALAATGSAQEVALHDKKAESYLPGFESRASSKEIAYINNVNGKVLKNFYRVFGEKPDARWFRAEEGYVVHFKDSNITTNVYYRQNGTVQYKVNYYAESRLSKDVRHTIKSNFYDYAIVNVSEVHANGAVYYFIKIEDKSSIKTVRVTGQDWEIVETLVKQKDYTTEEDLL